MDLCRLGLIYNTTTTFPWLLYQTVFSKVYIVVDIACKRFGDFSSQEYKEVVRVKLLCVSPTSRPELRELSR